MVPSGLLLTKKTRTESPPAGSMTTPTAIICRLVCHQSRPRTSGAPFVFLFLRIDQVDDRARTRADFIVTDRSKANLRRKVKPYLIRPMPGAP